MRDRLLLGGILLAGVATALIAGQAGQQQQQQRDTAQQQRDSAIGRQIQGQPQAADQAGSTDVDQHFVDCAARANLFEIKAGEMISERVQDEQVKRLARKIADEHTQWQTQLKEAAQKSGLQVPDQLEQWQQSKLSALEKMNPQNLAVDYAFHQVGGHHVALLACQREIAMGQKPEIKQFATQALPNLQAHLREANQTAMKFTGGRGITGEAVGPAGQQRPGERIRQQESPSQQQR